MKFFYFVAGENHHFSLAYKNLSETVFHIHHCNIMMPTGFAQKQSYSYHFNTGYDMGPSGCNYKGYGISHRTYKPSSFETTFREALIETFL